MKIIRIGNDFTVEWTVTRMREASSLEGLDLHLYIDTPRGRMEVDEYLLDGNKFRFLYPGSRQLVAGVYGLTLTINEGKDNMSAVDACKVFRLVESGCAACSDALYGEGIVVECNSDIVIPANGMSAYEIAVLHGFQGTEEEWVASLKKPAEDAAEEVKEQAKGWQEQEDARQKAEQGRVAAENRRVENENQRVASEQGRVTAEQGRVKAESERQSNEEKRQSGEDERKEAETARKEAEKKRASDEEARQMAVKLASFASDIMEMKVDEGTLDMIYKSMKMEDIIEDAKKEGAVAERNKKIEVARMKREDTDGLPGLDKGKPGGEPKSKGGIADTFFTGVFEKRAKKQ